MYNNNDDEFLISATGDVVVGDYILFQVARWSGKYPKAKFDGLFWITGTVVNESYGKRKQQHTFTVDLDSGKTQLIKGRVLYRYGVFRQPWPDETKRALVVAEKHERGNEARAERDKRKTDKVRTWAENY